MPKKLLSILLLSALLTGCIILPDDGYRHRSRRDRYGVMLAPAEPAVFPVAAAGEEGIARA